MFAFKGSDAIIRFRCGAEEVGSEERAQPETGPEDAG
jgi:hypothetical protein